MPLICVSDVFAPLPLSQQGEGRSVRRESSCGVGGWGEQMTFCPRVVLTLFGGGVGGGRVAAGLGDEGSIRFVGTQYLSRIKSDLAFLS